MNKHIAVLMGGWSSEREVSISSGLACAEALEALGFQVSKIDVDRNIPSVLASNKISSSISLLLHSSAMPLYCFNLFKT